MSVATDFGLKGNEEEEIEEEEVEDEEEEGIEGSKHGRVVFLCAIVCGLCSAISRTGFNKSPLMKSCWR